MEVGGTLRDAIVIKLYALSRLKLRLGKRAVSDKIRRCKIIYEILICKLNITENHKMIYFLTGDDTSLNNVNMECCDR
jgi:hypothetical protein